MTDTPESYEKDIDDITNYINVCTEQAQSIRDDISEYDKGVNEMRQIADRIEKINSPKKRWYEYLGVKPVKQRFTFEIEGRPVFTEQELAERRAFLDGYDAGRKDGDSHKAYKLWHKMIQHSDK